jgi:hypothetical protein
LSLNPLGFLQFGPIVNAEFGVDDDLVINTHVRFSSLGLLTYVSNYDSDGLDQLSGMAIGGGVLKFFGENQSKPYAGILLEYEWGSQQYAMGEPWEWYRDENYGVMIFNGGYRFRFDEGFFINAGLFLGAAVGRYTWDYADLSYGENDNEPRQGTHVVPFGMLEVAFGMEF